MIDFTHVRRDGRMDHGYIKGLRRLVEILVSLQEGHPRPKADPQLS